MDGNIKTDVKQNL